MKPSRADIERMVPDEGEDFYDEAVTKMVSFFGQLEFPVTVYRALVVSKGAEVELTQAGEHWSPYREAVVRFATRWDPSPSEEVVLLESTMREQDVDWRETALAFVMNYGCEEYELTARRSLPAREIARSRGGTDEEVKARLLAWNPRWPMTHTIGRG